MNAKRTLYAALLLCGSAASAAGKAKNIIFFLGDGMGPTTVTATRIYLYGEGGKLHMEQLPRAALVKTFSLDAQTTDSAPSMSAYMTGVKMRNEVLSMTPDTVARIETDGHCAATGNGTSVPTLLELAKAAGKAVGVVTTTEATHATPAATYAHICHRDLAYDIAAQAVPGGAGYNPALGSGLEVLMGGSQAHWTPRDATTNPGGRPDGRNLLAELQGQGYSVVKTASELRTVGPATKLIGLFSASSHLSYELDRDGTKEPSLAEMTLRALEVLKRAATASGSDKGFFLMVEGGRIDHALHGTQAQKVLADTAALDAAVKAAQGAVSLADTLIVVTADHDHTMSMNGYGQRGQGLHVLDVVRDRATGAPLVDGDGYPYPTLVFGNGPNRPLVRSGTDTLNVLDKNFLHLSGVRLSSETHGGGDVMLMAGGADSEAFKGTLDNTAVFGLVRTAVGL
jgi:alkaline phosphatase